MRWLQSAPPKPAIPRRTILVVPLLMKDPTSAGEQGEVTQDSVVAERKETAAEAEPALGAMTRSRSRRMAALAALAPSIPEEILVWEILVRLPAKDILRCRAVCRRWRRLTSAADFLVAHHRSQPSLPLLTLYSKERQEDGLPIFERGRPVLGFDDYDHFKVHASCDGLLLLSLFGPRYSLCNPATRQCVRIPCLDHYDIEIAALYLHCPSREYRVLYRKDDRHKQLKAAYYILTVQPGMSLPRCIIEVSSDTPAGSENTRLISYKSTAATVFAPPIVFHGCLHWDPPGYVGSNADIVVFDTVAESFRFMRSPADATRFCTRLCDMQGSMGFSCFDDDNTVVKIWVLEDYVGEVWSLKYHVKLPLESFHNPEVEDTRHLVLSHHGDVLVYSCSDYMFHCDSNGKLLEAFRFDQWSLGIIENWFKESLVSIEHNLFPGPGKAYRQPSLFHML